MKTAHTPGPWTYHLGRGANPRHHIQAGGGYQIASTTELNKHSLAKEENEMREANSRLIAAAPELLAALEGALAQLTGPVMVHGNGIGANGRKTGLSGEEFKALREQRLELIRAAIAKAKDEK